MGFTINPNLIADLERSAEIREAMHHAAEQIAQTAQAIAPVGNPNEDDHPGQFRDSIHAEGDRVVAEDPASVYIIFGTSRTPPHDTLRRAAELHGFKPVRG